MKRAPHVTDVGEHVEKTYNNLALKKKADNLSETLVLVYPDT